VFHGLALQVLRDIAVKQRAAARFDAAGELLFCRHQGQRSWADPTGLSRPATILKPRPAPVAMKVANAIFGTSFRIGGTEARKGYRHVINA
jgi:hypothetical protein